MHSSILIWFSLIFIFESAYCVSPTIRNTSNGPIEGIELITSLGQSYYAFKGVRFAEAPITGIDPLSGALVDRRFKVPEPLKLTWNYPQKTNKYERGCMQTPSVLTNPNYLSEDCLFLNVYVPYGGSERKPVLVFIHGGGWVHGDSTDLFYGPDFLMSQDNVLVTVQYRLGIFGLLNLGAYPYSGNMALKDQQLALKWVWNNIENFAGDKQKIMIFGESTGGAAVHFHMLNKESQQYFNRGYASSGTALNAWQRKNHVKLIQDCSQLYGAIEILKFLKTATSQRLLQCKDAWLPTIESPLTRGAFLTQPPDAIYKSNASLPIHTMFSITSQEGLILPQFDKSTEPLIKADWRQTNFPLPFEGFTKEAFPQEYKIVIEKLRAAYYPDPTNGQKVRDGNIALLSNLFVSNYVLQAIALQADVNKRLGSINTYFFRFSVDSAFNLIELIKHVKSDGAAHTDDLCYMFHCHILDSFNIYGTHLRDKDKAYDLIIRSVKLVSNFARNGNPSIQADTPFKSCKSSNEIYIQEVSNAAKTSVTNDIKKQLHYDLWLEIEQIYKSLNILSHESRKTALSK